MGPRVMLLKLLNKLRANVEIDKENFNTSSRQKCNETLPVDQNMSLVVAGTSAEKVLAEDKHQFSVIAFLYIFFYSICYNLIYY